MYYLLIKLRTVKIVGALSMQMGKYALLLTLALLLPVAVLSQPISEQITTASREDIDQPHSTSPQDLNCALLSRVAGQETSLKITYSIRADSVPDTRSVYRLILPEGFDLSKLSAQNSSGASGSPDCTIDQINPADRSIDFRLTAVAIAASQSSGSTNPDRIQGSFELPGIINPKRAGSYAVEVEPQPELAGRPNPGFSLAFAINPAALDSIVVIPHNDTTVKAGSNITFSAVGYDEFGNPIPGLTFGWTLEACTNCIGIFNDSVLTVTRAGTGVVVAISGAVSGRSGQITVVAGDLERMVLNVADTQFVGKVLRSAASIILYDHYNNLKKDYDLAANPITLVSSDGQLVPSILSSNSLQIGGVVRVLSANVRYLGATSAAQIYATNGSLNSNTITVHFNGYDIDDALDLTGRTVTSVVAGHNISVTVPVQNNGNLEPDAPVTLSARFRSGEGGAVQTSFTGSASGQVDSLPLQLPVHVTYPASDTLVFVLSSHFTADGLAYSVADTLALPIVVTGPAVLSVANGSLKPDTILSGHGFNLSLDILEEGFEGSIDSVHLSVQLAPDSGGTPFATLFDGSPTYSSIGSGTISYRDLPVVYTDDTLAAPTTYFVKVTYHIISSGNLFTLENEYPDSIVVIPAVSFSYVSGSFGPSTVFAGTNSAFSFDLDLQSTVPLSYCPMNTDFRLSGDAFNISTLFQSPDDTFIPGTNTLTSISVFIPENQAGNNLSTAASVHYCVPGIPDTLLYYVPFDTVGFPIHVVEHPVAQILSLDVVAPNAPRVNTSQNFQLSCRVANTSSTPIDSVIVRLTSDGGSIFQSDLVVHDIGAHDTSEVLFAIQAANVSVQAEVFRAEIISSDVGQAPPIDNIAFITIETPANLSLSYSLLGASSSVVDFNTAFQLSVVLSNSGQADVTDGTYRMIAGGFDRIKPDTTTGTISADKPLSFSFASPSFDTTITLAFALTGIPNDANLGGRARIGDTTFTVIVRVISSEGQLVVNATQVGSSLILPGRSQKIFDLELTNSGASPLADLLINTIEILARDGKGVPVDVRSVINIGNTGFFENGIKVAMTTASDNRLVFTFDHFQLDAGVTRTLNFVAELKDTKVETLNLELAKDQIQAVFIAGPNAGQAPVITSDQPGSSIMDESLAIKGASLESSFLVRSNPFDPTDPIQSPLEFSYELPADARVEFRVFTLTGEMVYAKDYTAGGEGGRSGENFIYWDGRNDDGIMVFNGVYIVSIRDAATDEHARLKLAVVK